MVMRYIGKMTLNDNKVVTEESLKEYTNSPVILFTGKLTKRF